MRQLRLPATAAEQFFRRMVFNVVARNQDDHTKNISFLLNPAGEWALAPAYDVAYAYNPANRWLRQHQMSVNGQRDGITGTDVRRVAREMNIRRADEVIKMVVEQVARWPEFAAQAGVANERIARVGATFRRMT